MNFPCQLAVLIHAATDDDGVGFDVLSIADEVDTQQANVADIVLSAGVGAAGQVDVNRVIEFELFVEVTRQFDGLALGVGGGILAAGIASAGDEAASDAGALCVETNLL